MDPLLQLIPGDETARAKNLNRIADVEQNIANVQREFIGKPLVCYELVKHIIYIRREIDLEENTDKFFELWDKYKDTLLKEYDIRWLLSVVDTIVDVGDNQESAVAMNISQCVNQCNIHTSLLLNAVDGTLDPDKLRKEQKVPTWGGMITVDVPTGDMIFNMMVRLNRIAQSEPLLNNIWLEIKRRLKNDASVPMNQLCAASSILHQRVCFR